jgi:DNA repair protein RecO (recombination protein O)
MICKTNGIVLHTVKYGENSMIATIYTDQFGRLSFVVHGARGTKAGNRISLVQPLFLVELEIYYKQSRSVQRIKEIRLSYPWLDIPYRVNKSVQAMFLAEVLYRILQEEERNNPLYSFIEGSLRCFDNLEQGAANFHIWFLSRLTEFLGIMPQTNRSNGGWFDLRSGTLSGREPLHSDYLSREISELFLFLTKLPASELPGVRITREQRIRLLEGLLNYLHLHFDGFGNIRSLEVLKEVFE